MSFPNFMCLGAAKSGTTTLYDILRQHPDVYIPAFKEPHFFDIPENYKNGIRWYEKNYFKNANQKIVADFTPSYFFDKEAPKRIFESLGGKVKFVVILRNPVDRAYSHYLHSIRDEHENLSFIDSLISEKERLQTFEKEGDYLSYLRNSYSLQGQYGDMLERYLKYYSLENFLFIHFEEGFIEKRDQTIQKVLNFLQIKNDVKLKIDLKSNPASKEKSKFLKRLMNKKAWWRSILKFMITSVQLRQTIRNRIQRSNIKEFKAEKITLELKSELYNKYFKSSVVKFENLSNNKMNWK